MWIGLVPDMSLSLRSPGHVRIGAGWWIGPHFGSKADVVAHAPGESLRPPATGWLVRAAGAAGLVADPEAKLAPPTESLPLEELRLDAAFSSMTAPGNEQTC